jgi:Concanavalin A-like lectin/glucanases superfamily
MRRLIYFLACLVVVFFARSPAAADTSADQFQAKKLFGTWVGNRPTFLLGETGKISLVFKAGATMPDAPAMLALPILGHFISLAPQKSYRLEIDSYASEAAQPGASMATARKRLQSVLALIVDELRAGGLEDVKIRTFVSEEIPEAQRKAGASMDRIEIRLTRVAAPADGTLTSWSDLPGVASPPALFAFRASGDGRSFPLSDPRLNATGHGTVDLWFSAEWEHLVDYDPALFTIVDAKGVRFALHILGNRGGFALWDGTAGGYVAIESPLMTHGPQHLALVTMGKETQLVLNGTPLEPPLPVGYGVLDPVGLILGAGPDGADPFVGKIGGLKIWSDSVPPADWWSLPGKPAGMPPVDPLRSLLVAAMVQNPATSLLELSLQPPLFFALAGCVG